MKPAISWLPVAEAELQAAGEWYWRIGPELRDRFARQVEVTVQEINKRPMQFAVVHGNCGVPVYHDFHTEYSLRFRTAGSLSWLSFMASVTLNIGDRAKLVINGDRASPELALCLG